MVSGPGHWAGPAGGEGRGATRKSEHCSGNEEPSAEPEGVGQRVMREKVTGEGVHP